MSFNRENEEDWDFERGPRKKKKKKFVPESLEDDVKFQKAPVVKESAVVEDKNEIPIQETIAPERLSEEEREKKKQRLVYLATGLVDDLKTLYDEESLETEEITKRLDDFGIKRIEKKNYAYGSFLADKLDEFLRVKDKNPEGWDFVSVNLGILGLKRDEMIEARKIPYKERVRAEKIKIISPELGEEHPLKRFRENEDLKVIDELIDLTKGLSKEDLAVFKTIIEEALHALKDVNRDKKEWDRLYKPLLLNLGVPEAKLEAPVV